LSGCSLYPNQNILHIVEYQSIIILLVTTEKRERVGNDCGYIKKKLDEEQGKNIFALQLFFPLFILSLSFCQDKIE
jgi:hypothetical protein